MKTFRVCSFVGALSLCGAVWSMEIDLSAGEERTITDSLDLGDDGLVLRGNGLLKLVGNNSWKGKTVIYGGVLAAKRGVGLPTASELVMAGGSWAPLDGTAPVAVNKVPGVLSAADGAPLGVTAVDGNETIDLTGDGSVWTNPSNFGNILINDKADGVLTVANGMTLGAETTITVGSTESGSKTVFAGSVSSTALLKVNGTGRLDLEGGTTLQSKGIELSNRHVVIKDKASVSVQGAAAQMHSPDGTTVDIEKGATFTGNNEISMADGNGVQATVNVSGVLSTTGWMRTGRKGTATGTLNVNEGGNVSATALVVGEGQSTAVVNQYGGSVRTTLFYMGNQIDESSGAGTATYNMSGGTFEVTSSKFNPYFGWYGLTYFNLSGGVLTLPASDAYIGTYGKTYFNQTGGKITFQGNAYLNWHKAAPAGAYAQYDLKGGELTASGEWRVGNNGVAVMTVDTHDSGSLEFKKDVTVGGAGQGTLNLRSGTMKQTGGRLYVAREAGSDGSAVNISGGVLDYLAENGVVSVGTVSQGSLTVSGGVLRTPNGGHVELGYSDPNPGFSGQGTINLSGDGVIETTRIHAGYGAAHGVVNADGGTIRALRDSGAFLDNVELNLGGNGLTFDSNGHDVNASGAVLGKTAGRVRKVGAGTVSVHDFPYAKRGIEVESGTLQVVPQGLRHRWTFDGTFDDVISGAKSALNNNVSLTSDGKALNVASDTQIDLGANMLPVDHDATIEMWLTRTSSTKWEKLFCLGANKNDQLYVGTMYGNENTAIVGYVDSNASGGYFSKLNEKGLGEMPKNERIHLSVTITRTSSTSMDLVYRMKRSDGSEIGSVTLQPTGTLGTLLQDSFWIGTYPNESTATACTVDEVRIWDTALTDRQLATNAALGPDALPQLPATQTATDEDVLLPENPSKELVANNYLAHRWTFDGTLDDAITGAASAGSSGISYTEDGKALHLSGGNVWNSYVNLGANLLPNDDSPVTIEMWATDCEYRNSAKAFSFGSGRNDLLSLNTNSGGEDKPGYLTFCASGLTAPNAQVDFPLLSENRFGQRLYYAIALVPKGDGTADATFRVKDAATGKTLDEQRGTVNWTPKKSAQGGFYLGLSYWSNEGPVMNFEEIRFWNAALSDVQMTANVLRGPDELPTTFDSIPLKVEVAKDSTLDLGYRPLTLHDLDAAGSLGSANVTVDGVVTPGGDGTVGTLKVDGSLTVTGTLRLDLGDMIELTGDLTLDGATIEFTAPMEEVDAYVREHHGWTVATTTAGTISAKDLVESRHSFRWRNRGKVLKAFSPGLTVLIR